MHVDVLPREERFSVLNAPETICWLGSPGPLGSSPALLGFPSWIWGRGPQKREGTKGRRKGGEEGKEWMERDWHFFFPLPALMMLHYTR